MHLLRCGLLLLGLLCTFSFEVFQGVKILQDVATSIHDTFLVAPWRALQSVNPMRCSTSKECFDAYGACVDGFCMGFTRNINADNLYRCVDAYSCNVPDTFITGAGITENFRVRAIEPNAECGVAPALSSTTSMFSTNEWSCIPSSDRSKCAFNAGVGFRLNKSNPKEVVKLCGCPDNDLGKDTVRCNQNVEFNTQLGFLGVQECIANVHCGSNLMAYCTGESCGNVNVLSLATAMQAVDCLSNSSCTFASLASRYTTEAFKVIGVASELSCGAEAALDPNYIKDNALPCLFSFKNDGTCDVNFSIYKLTNKDRLCGCPGVDLGGDGIACNEAADFISDIGLMANTECIMSSDCNKTSFCFAGKCTNDTFPPKIERMEPPHGSFVVAPLKNFTLYFNEGVQLNNATTLIRPKMYISSTSASYSIPLSAPGRIHGVKIAGNSVVVSPNVLLDGLPEGVYSVSLDANSISDLHNNIYSGFSGYQFAVSNTVGCPYMYVTGFPLLPSSLFNTSAPLNVNGLYLSSSPRQNKATWKRNVPLSDNKVQNFNFYWRPPNDSTGSLGVWLLDVDFDTSAAIAFSDATATQYAIDKQRPLNGTWSTYKGGNATDNTSWYSHTVNVFCSLSDKEKNPPTLNNIIPALASVDFPVNGTIELQFNRPVYYGESGKAYLKAQTLSHQITYDTAIESKMRGRFIQADGTNTIKLVSQENLRFGENYTLSFDSNFIVDAYDNPWGKIDPNVITFRTYGIPCDAYNLPTNVTSIMTASGSGQAHNATRNIRCVSGKSPNKNATYPYVVTCSNGKWSSISSFQCYNDCPSYVNPNSTLYSVKGTDVKHDTNITISCTTVASSVNTAVKEQVISCNNGEWQKRTLQCELNCPGFPKFNDRYIITGEGVSNNSSRVVKCAPAAQLISGTQPETIKCVNSDWQPSFIQCKVSCLVYQSPGEYTVVAGTGFIHGSQRIISCENGYALSTGAPKATATCLDGTWSVSKVRCVKTCGTFNPGRGYEMKVSGPPNDIEGTVYSLTCKSNAVNLSANNLVRDTASCVKGMWTKFGLACKSSCPTPSAAFGQGYTVSPLSYSHLRLDHDATLVIQCTDTAIRTSVISSELIVCDDGEWLSANTRLPITLRCLAPCRAPSFSQEYVVATQGADFQHGASLDVRCAQNYVATVNDAVTPMSSNNNGTSKITCNNGRWEFDTLGYACRSPCNAIEMYTRFSQERYLMAPLPQKNAVLVHGSVINLSCTVATVVLPNNRARIDSAVCIDGNWETKDLLCLLPGCNDGIKNGDETGIDCGGSCPQACPTCMDGMKNGDETGVDCGGSCATLCPPSCSDGIMNRDETGIDCGGLNCPAEKPCPPTCADNVQNGDETGVDCGGSCGLCASCTSINLPLGTIIVQKAAYSIANAPHGAFFMIHCNAGLFPNFRSASLVSNEAPLLPSTSSSPSIPSSSNIVATPSMTNTALSSLVSVGVMQLKCLNGSWIYPNYTCERANCHDGIRNGDETGVDCGGSCSQTCSTCSDGLRNGDETGVDCGGSCPSYCEKCSLEVIKYFSSNPSYQVQYFPETYAVLEYWNISCSSSAVLTSTDSVNSTSLTVRCIGGQWSPSPFSLHCEPKEQLITVTYPIRTLPFPRPIFNRPTSECKSTATNIVETGPNDCCSLRAALLAAFEKDKNECENLLFKENSIVSLKKVCQRSSDPQKPSCIQRLEDTITVYSKRTGKGCSDVEKFKKLLSTFCYVDKGTNSACFSQVKDHTQYFQIFTMTKLSPSQLQDVCIPGNCIRNSVLYMETLNALDDPSNGLLSIDAPTLLRRLRTTSPDEDNESNIQQSHTQTESLNKFAWDKEDSEAELINENNGKWTEEGYGRISTRQLLDNNDYIFENMFYGKYKKSESVMSLLRLRYVTTGLLDIMCTKVHNEYCTNVAIDVIYNNPIVSLPDTNTACNDPCYSLVSRRLGFYLISTGSLADKLTGEMLLSFGRYYCTTNRRGDVCGSFLFPSMKNAMPRSRSLPVKDGDAKCNSLCRNEYIGDGYCDDMCFTPECQFDGNDCRIDHMYPLVAGRAFSLFSLDGMEDECNLLKENFTCHKGGMCRKKVEDAILAMGCCVNSVFSLMKDVTRLIKYVSYKKRALSSYSHDSISPINSSVNSSSPSLLASSSNLGSLNTLASPSTSPPSIPTPYMSENESLLDSLRERTAIELLETKCENGLDKTCSLQGRKKRERVLLKLANVDYDKVILVANGKKNALSDTISYVIAYHSAVSPFHDIAYVNYWKGSLITEVIVEAEESIIDTAISLLGEAIEEKTIEKTLNDAFFKQDTFYSAIKENVAEPITVVPLSIILSQEVLSLSQSSSFSTPSSSSSSNSTTASFSSASNASSPLELGLLGMYDLESLLVPSDCLSSVAVSLPMTDKSKATGLRSLSNVSDYYIITDTSNMRTTNGATRTISCSKDTYEVQGRDTTQILTCLDGAWLPPKGEDILHCRKPCQLQGSYDKDTYNVISTMGMGVSDDVVRSGFVQEVKCKKENLWSSSLYDKTNTTCNNGKWSRIMMTCSNCSIDALLGMVDVSKVKVESYTGSSAILLCEGKKQENSEEEKRVEVKCSAAKGWEKEVENFCRKRIGARVGPIIGISCGALAVIIVGILGFVLYMRKKTLKSPVVGRVEEGFAEEERETAQKKKSGRNVNLPIVIERIGDVRGKKRGGNRGSRSYSHGVGAESSAGRSESRPSHQSTSHYDTSYQSSRNEGRHYGRRDKDLSYSDSYDSSSRTDTQRERRTDSVSFSATSESIDHTYDYRSQLRSQNSLTIKGKGRKVQRYESSSENSPPNYTSSYNSQFTASRYSSNVGADGWNTSNNNNNNNGKRRGIKSYNRQSSSSDSNIFSDEDASKMLRNPDGKSTHSISHFTSVSQRPINPMYSIKQ